MILNQLIVEMLWLLSLIHIFFQAFMVWVLNDFVDMEWEEGTYYSMTMYPYSSLFTKTELHSFVFGSFNI